MNLSIAELKSAASDVLGPAVLNTFSYLTARTVEVAGVPHVVLPPNVKLESLAGLLERDAPARIRRKVVAHDVRGLIDYVNAYKGAPTKLYCGPATKPGILARIDDHAIGAPSHLEHACEYPCPFTVEWLTWTGQNRKRLAQVEFAEFIEANAKDIQQPSAADLFQLVTNFSDAREADFASAVRLSDGQVQLSYVEKDKPGKVVLPERIQLALPVFEGATHAYLLDARLRYRLDRTDLALWYELDRPDVVQRQAYDQLLAAVTEATAVPLYRAL